jgi:hypothetical protein
MLWRVGTLTALTPARDPCQTHRASAILRELNSRQHRRPLAPDRVQAVRVKSQDLQNGRRRSRAGLVH